MDTTQTPAGGVDWAHAHVSSASPGVWASPHHAFFSGAHEGAECGETSAGTGRARCFGWVPILVVFQLGRPWVAQYLHDIVLSFIFIGRQNKSLNYALSNRIRPRGSLGSPWAPEARESTENHDRNYFGIPPLRSAQPVVFVSLEFGPRAPHSLVELPHAGQGLRGKFWAACGRIPTGSEPTTGPKLSGPNAQTIWNRFLVCSS